MILRSRLALAARFCSDLVQGLRKMSDGVAALELVETASTVPADQVEQIVEYVFDHRKEAVKTFLAARDLPVSGTKDELRQRVETGLKDGSVTAEDLIALLDTIEGWGNQHLYLYESPAADMRVWKDETKAKKRLGDSGFGDLFNRRRPLVLPNSPTLSAVEWTKTRVRFVWVEKRRWDARLEEKDRPPNAQGISYKAYEEQLARGITTFDWNLVSGEAALMIQQLPRGENYADVRAHYEAELSPILDLSTFTRRRIRTAIRNIEKSKEALNRKIELETARGGGASYTSKGKKSDAYADPDLKNSRAALGGKTTSKNGNFYFLPKPGKLTRMIHVKLYSKDQRVGIFGECIESEVEYVLSRVRQHSR
jgi:hypothetical protein